MTDRCTRAKCSCKDSNMLFTKFCGCSDDGTHCERFQLETELEERDYTADTATALSSDIELSSDEDES